MKRIVLVRHGESEWNAARRLQGQADIGLSERGRTQARALAPMVAALAPTLVLTSDLQRARDTASLLGYPDARPEALLREQSVGIWTGEAIDGLKAGAPEDYRAWRAGTFAPEGAEDWATFCQRIDRALALALADGADTALVVCHGGVIRAALDLCLRLEPARLIPVGPASLTVLAFPDGSARLEAFNVAARTLELDAPD
ncbi:histidine phosphatase family protein [Marinivivus vitaminiproducens]|uniref:histidine phosphatase family protein n=1 Tax=Marinivivus vitaminiproducens TaxID=3035935 RepID=UPI0027A9600A|nr:histidine phosphatase family protein [Geminicoccaceae bacterium SCSIO 64248]